MIEVLISNKLNYLLFIICYFIGSIPFGYILYKIIKKDDIRKYGSGNIGATNVNRLIGKKFGSLTLILDFLKTFLPCLLMHIYLGTESGVISGFFVVIGHIFPIWLKFKGGKGVASFIAFILVTSWPFFIVFSISWLGIIKLLKYSSLAAIFSIIINLIVFKLILYLQFNNNLLLWIPGEPIEFQFTLLLSIIILCKHYSNISSLLRKKY
ncbi:MAG: acyl-phosphate glycerol 3-phosphate acyltransferase [Pelagibacterales bacterium]|nr:acyl-phosphate glycerol 3-phosphate acyltransferase [Pelagibacterales bacterium]OUU62336.1 MAG: acyl-phosphate glycerol 3-phosphate acyltransferase [Alphaproteobacteria bacterium TMED62]|tara:strand:+ start:2092 stop:2721 length:630 start_codon:yes stop_codon:yes gene_type:complete